VANAKVVLAAERDQIVHVQLQFRVVFERLDVVDVQVPRQTASLATGVQFDELVADSLPLARAFAVGSHRLDRLDMLLDRLVWYRTYRVGEKVRDDTE
jgi:hypothetical protein